MVYAFVYAASDDLVREQIVPYIEKLIHFVSHFVLSA